MTEATRVDLSHLEGALDTVRRALASGTREILITCQWNTVTVICSPNANTPTHTREYLKLEAEVRRLRKENSELKLHSYLEDLDTP